MEKKVIFLESATKKKTIQSFLGEEYTIFATSGHLRELKKTGEMNLGVNLKTFVPSYEIVAGKTGLINFWRKFLKERKVSEIYLATDPDREGEAIAQETAELLNLEKSQYQRILFYEITPQNIRQALANPLNIDEKLVEAQMSRQVLDRMVGFCLSKNLQKELKAASAGRVQSIVLKLIVEREKLVEGFAKKEEYVICGIAEDKDSKNLLTISQVNDQGKLVVYPSKSEAEKIKSQLAREFTIQDKVESQIYILPKEPLITSLLLFEAKSQLGFTVEQTTKTAQKLYEGVAIKGKMTGLITYPRTDSNRINKNFSYQAYNHITNKFGKEYCNFQPLWSKKKKKANVQDAHEAIHPTSLNYHPEEIRSCLHYNEYLLYKLIYTHTVSSLMSPAKVCKKVWKLTNNDLLFQATERIPLFTGFLINSPDYYFRNYNVKLASSLEAVKSLPAKRIEIREHKENKPVRFNEGSMVQELERIGVGRPSTYNSFGKIILKRGYAVLDKRENFVPTELGKEVNNWLQKNFPSLINENYTASLEKNLDQISNGENTYFQFIQEFWKNFCLSLTKMNTKIKKIEN